MRWKAVLVLLAILPLCAAGRRARYALILPDDPAVKALPRGARRDAPELAAARKAIAAKQAAVRARVEALGFRVTGSADTLLNAIFVIADESDLPRLRSIPGVKYVSPLRRPHLALDKAAILVDAPNAWNVMGGIPNAGAGQKIGIIDTGIDQTHPAFQDASLATPPGYPICGTPADCAFTNNKVIVARSYVAQDAGIGDPATSFPDDLSARDRVGHGTAVAMCAAGNTNSGPLATITGLAPHAYLGNYKVYGSPGINDGGSDDAVIMALNDAFNDGMDVVNYSSGGPALTGPADTGAACGLSAGAPCDPVAVAIGNAIDSQNMVVVVAAGNDGDDTANTTGLLTLNSISSPAYVPDAIAVAATENSRDFYNSVQISGPSVPASLQSVGALTSLDGAVLGTTFTAPLLDAALVGDGYGCSGYPAGSLNGYIALIERGPAASPCFFDLKVNEAQAAGAAGVIVYDDVASEPLIQMSGLGDTVIPAFFIGNADGLNLKAYVDTNTGVTAGLNPGFSIPYADPNTNQVTSFSSRGPAIGTNSLKPDVAAPGEFLYMAAQNYDPNGELYDPSRYIVSQGTSFSTPIVSGIAALVRQNHPNFTATQVKSAIVNTATSDTSDPYFGTSGQTPSPVMSVGGGKVEALNAINSTVTAEPATLSFGAIPAGSVSLSLPLTITNKGTAAVTVNLGVNRMVTDPATLLSIEGGSPIPFTLQAGAAQSFQINLTGRQPSAGIYQGSIQITGGPVALNVPYLYLVGDGIPANVVALAGDGDVGVVGNVPSQGEVALKVLDQYGVPVVNYPVSWYAPDGGAFAAADNATNGYGIATAVEVLGVYPGSYYTFEVFVGNTSFGYAFEDYAVDQPVIVSNSVVNAASFSQGNGIAPGSWVAVFGTSLAFGTASAAATPLPISIDGTSVGFDATNVSAPGALSFVSYGQVNVQVPWELAGQSSVQMKVNVEPVNGVLAAVPVTAYSPAMFTVNGFAAAEDLSGNVISAANPAIRGNYISLYCNGLGPVTNQPATGAPGPGGPLAETTATPTVTIGGQTAPVEFSGLAPGLVGLYQLNVQIPPSLAPGNQPVMITIGGVTAPVVNIPVG